MGSRILVEFVKQHSWKKPLGFKVYCEEGYYLYQPFKDISRGLVPLYDHSWEKAGFGFGRFGFGSFGWAQGGLIKGGFGYGKFGWGEFGYYNELVRWTSEDRFADGLYCVGVQLFGQTGIDSYYPVERRILIATPPDAPGLLRFKSMGSGKLTVAWSKSKEV